MLILVVLFQGCSAIYIGGGAVYDTPRLTGGESRFFINAEDGDSLVFPGNSSGAGYYVEAGRMGEGGGYSLTYSSYSKKGDYSGLTYESSHSYVSAGGRIPLEGVSFGYLYACVPVNVSYHWLTVKNGSTAVIPAVDAVFTGTGIEAGIGAFIYTEGSLFFTADCLYRLDFFSTADGGNGGGRLKESIMTSGFVFKAGINLALPALEL